MYQEIVPQPDRRSNAPHRVNAPAAALSSGSATVESAGRGRSSARRHRAQDAGSPAGMRLRRRQRAQRRNRMALEAVGAG